MTSPGVARLPWAAVLVNRLVWAALVAGQVAFAAVVAVTTANGGGPQRGRVAMPLVAADGAVLVVGTIVAVACRLRRLPAEPDRLRPAYRRNVILPMAVLEGAAFFGIALWLAAGTPWPAAAVPAASLLVQLWLWPRSRVRVG